MPKWEQGGVRAGEEEQGLKCVLTHYPPPLPLTFLASLLPRSVDVVLELDADLPLCGLVTDEGEL